MTSADGTLDKIIQGIFDIFPDLDGLEFNGETILGEIPDWDSMAAVNLQVFIEETFKVQLPLDLLNENAKIAEVVHYIDNPAALKAAKRGSVYS
jgi:acyl carrier protein